MKMMQGALALACSNRSRTRAEAAGVFTLLPQDFGIPSPPSGERIHTGHAITVAFRVVALRSAVVFEI